MKTTIDWLCFRTQADVLEGLEALRPLYGTLGSHLKLKTGLKGSMGFQQACSVTMVDMELGRVDFGGDSQRGWARWSLTGRGCEWVKDWDAIDQVEALPSSEIRRADIALTTWKGEVSHERVVAAHQAGGFVTRGRPPELQQIVSSDPRAGRTCYVGSRAKSPKFFRAYEKGFQLAAQTPGMHVQFIDGCPVEDIYRCELELKAADADIPWEVVERRDQYFAGAYPFLAELLPDVECDILMRRPERAPQTDLLAALANCRIQYGATLYTALRAYHGDITQVWDKIVGDKHSEALLQAGVLLVDHD